MRNTILLFLIPFVLFGCQNAQPKIEIGHNPLAIKFGDPFILHASDGKYYMYGTSLADGFEAFSSTNLKDWVSEGQVYTGATPTSWTVDCFWAPEVYELDGKFYLLFSANWKDNPTNEEEIFRIGVAVSDSPTGPFEEMNGGPLFDPGYPVIDGNLLFAEDGRVYLYYSRCCYKNPVESEVADWAREQGWFDEIEESWVYGVEMKPDFSGVIGDPVLLLCPPKSISDKQAEWESRSVTSREVNRRWTEGSYIFKEGDTYYMMYSANYYVGQYYAVGYATSKNPLGPFEKAANNPVLQKNVAEGGYVTGTGHNMVLTVDGQRYCVYHGRTEKTGNDRVVFIDPMEVLPDGQLVVYGPTVDPAKGFEIPSEKSVYNNREGLVPNCADPYVLEDKGVYYLYGTGGREGIKVYRSLDLANWSEAVGVHDGYALHKDDVWGNFGFWAPEVYRIGSKFYMYFTVQERIAVAESDSPLGPFVQSEANQSPFHLDVPEIDTHLFIDEDGKKYLYFVRFTNGNEIWCAELNDDLRTIKEETITYCFGASQPWEDSVREPHAHARVNEGPFILKHKGMYYMTYSANHTANPDYGVGYAIAKSPMGPWEKYEGNPILTGNGTTINGPGHHSFATSPTGQLYMIYHTHYDMTRMGPRKLGIDPCRFVPNPKGGADILQVDGPTDVPTKVK